ncbi:MAG: hypothetical protein RL136_789 [Planctomycetota bacterium]|jgi:hypothetical protein
MHSNRLNRDPQHVRSLIGKIDGGLDEARRKRMGPTTPPAEPTPGPRAEAPSRSEQTTTPATVAGSQSSVAPPIRAANEMFNQSGERLKARPKPRN